MQLKAELTIHVEELRAAKDKIEELKVNKLEFDDALSKMKYELERNQLLNNLSGQSILILNHFY